MKIKFNSDKKELKEFMLMESKNHASGIYSIIITFLK